MTEKRLLWAGVVVYGLAAWGYYEATKTPDQRFYERLRGYRDTARCCYWLARTFGKLAMRAELAYYRETQLT